MLLSLQMQQNNTDATCYDATDGAPAAASKLLDLSLTVNQLCTADPALVPVLASLGFVEIVKPMMLATVGRVMTIPKGAAMRGLDLNKIKEQLTAHGYMVVEGTKEVRP
jgi:hypothetical protein